VLGDSRRYEAQCLSDQQPLVWDRAEDVWITDVDGNVFLDFCSGVLVANIGHSHPRYVEAVSAQVARLCNCYDFATPERASLARKLVEITAPWLDRAFIVTTGSEAVEAALKAARRATGRWEVLSFGGAFHGRTFGAMSVGGNVGIRRGMGPVVPGVLHAPFPYCYRCPLGHAPDRCDLLCIDYLDYVVKTQSQGCLGTVITEPYQGAAGSIIPPPGWFERLEEWRTRHGALLIVDEVQSSFGRTGTLFAYEQWAIRPELVTLGKGLASGVPCAALMGTTDVFSHLAPGEMSSTSGGNPLSAAAALASIDIIESEGLVERARASGERAAVQLMALMGAAPKLGDVRGMGLVWGLEMVTDRATREPSPEAARRVVEACFQNGLALIAPIGLYGNVIRVAPPLTISAEALDIGLDILGTAVRAA
jgi:4-aminobutyrate aminotransferase